MSHTVVGPPSHGGPEQLVFVIVVHIYTGTDATVEPGDMLYACPCASTWGWVQLFADDATYGVGARDMDTVKIDGGIYIGCDAAFIRRWRSAAGWRRTTRGRH